MCNLSDKFCPLGNKLIGFVYFFRVVQKNLVFVVGLTQRLADPEVRIVSTIYRCNSRILCSVSSLIKDIDGKCGVWSINKVVQHEKTLVLQRERLESLTGIHDIPYTGKCINRWIIIVLVDDFDWSSE